jgi:hypothetical protein
MRASLGVLVLMLSCTDDGPGGPLPVHPCTTDVAPATEPLPQSGSRLRVIWLQGSDGSRQFYGMRDLVQNADCWPIRTGIAYSGRTYCIPDPGVDFSQSLEMHAERQSISTDLGAEFNVGDDGSGVFFKWVAQQDFANGDYCHFDDRGCDPLSAVSVRDTQLPMFRFFDDANCTQPADASLLPNIRLQWWRDPPSPQLVLTEALPDVVYYQFGFPGPTGASCEQHTGASRAIQDVTCAIVPGAPSHGFSGTRLAAEPQIEAHSPGYDYHAPAGLWRDAMFDTQCALYEAADGAQRCLPFEPEHFNDVLSYDPNCVTMPILQLDPARVSAMPDYLYVARMPVDTQHVYRVTGPLGPVSQAIYKYDAFQARCVETVAPIGPLYAAEEVAPAEFVEFTRVVE